MGESLESLHREGRRRGVREGLYGKGGGPYDRKEATITGRLTGRAEGRF